ncbi:type II toxin-antitoxin system Phd/YefM family antitoxin [Thermodesulfobacteriota bacterium]
MEERYTIAEAKNRLPSIIHSVEKGPAVQLTRHGRPVAVLLSIKEYERLNRKREGYWRALKSWRNLMAKEGIAVADEAFEIPRDSSPGREVDLS